MGPDPTQAFFWPAEIIFLTRLDRIFLTRREKIEKFGIFREIFQTQRWLPWHDRSSKKMTRHVSKFWTRNHHYVKCLSMNFDMVILKKQYNMQCWDFLLLLQNSFNPFCETQNTKASKFLWKMFHEKINGWVIRLG